MYIFYSQLTQVKLKSILKMSSSLVIKVYMLVQLYFAINYKQSYLRVVNITYSNNLILSFLKLIN